MRRTTFSAVIAALSLTILSGAGHAAQLSLPLTDDAWINGALPNSNYGAATGISVQDQGPKFGLVRFDASAIAGQSVTQATLRIFVRTVTGSGQLSVVPIASSWSEGSVTWTLQPPAESSTVASVSLTTASANKVISLNVTGVVQRWASGSLPMAGLLLSTLSPMKVTIDSKERTGGVRAVLEVVTEGDGFSTVSTPAIVMDLSKTPVTIKKPGLYVLDKDWTVADIDPDAGIIRVENVPGDVVIDLRGHSLLFVGDLAITVTSSRATIRNGRVSPTSELEGMAIVGVDSNIDVDNLTIAGGFRSSVGTMEIKNSKLIGGYVAFGSAVQFQNSRVISPQGNCLVMVAGQLAASGNTFECRLAAVWLDGSHSAVVARNTIYSDFGSAIYVEGNGNAIIDNIINSPAVPPEQSNSPSMLIDGSANFIRGNVAFGWYTGIKFAKSGNIYVGNQMDATVPFHLNGTAQSDLGGNVGF